MRAPHENPARHDRDVILRDMSEATTISFDIARGKDVRTPAVHRTSIGDIKRLKEEGAFFRLSWE